VLGAERSGTSVVAEMIQRWGAYAGESDELSPASEHSPRGQWEYEPLWDVLAEIGDFAQGATWWDPAFEDNVRAKSTDRYCVDKAHALIGRMERGGEAWMWKDPALCHFLPFWKPIWGDVAYVVTVRHPYDVARSWQRMAVPPELHDSVDMTRCNLLRWQHMLLMVLRATDDTDRKVFVSYERLVDDPEAEAKRLAAFLDRHSLSSEGDAVASMAEVVNPSFRRNRCERPLNEIPEATAAQVALYEFLKSRIDDPSAPFVDGYPMPPDWWSFVHESEAVVRSQ
jgi:hypothetical protein